MKKLILAALLALACRPDATGPTVVDGQWVLSSFVYTEGADTATLADAYDGANKWTIAFSNGRYISEGLLMFKHWPNVPDSILQPDSTYRAPIVVVFGFAPCAEPGTPSSCQMETMSGLYVAEADSIDFAPESGATWPFGSAWRNNGSVLTFKVIATLWTVEVTFARTIHALAPYRRSAVFATRDGTRAVARPRHMLDVWRQVGPRCWWSHPRPDCSGTMDHPLMARYDMEAHGVGDGAGLRPLRRL